MSEVFLAYDVREPRFVALKFLKGQFRHDPAALGRLKREAEIYRTLNHPGVVRLVEEGQDEDGGSYIAMEHLRGRSVGEWMEEEDRTIPLPQAMILLEDIGSALNAAHRAGIIHRDIQPTNIMIDPDGRATLYDFGIAFASDGFVRTEIGTVMGTLLYASPEQRRGEKVDHRTDIFAVGAILYELLTKKKAIRARTFEEAMSARTASLPRPSSLNPDVPPELDEIVCRLFDDDPDARFQDLRTLLIDIGKLRLEGDEALKERLFGARQIRKVDEATTALRAGRLAEARKLSQELQEEMPENLEAEVLRLMAKLQVHDGDFERANKNYEKALFYAEDHLELTLEYSLNLLRLGEIEKTSVVLEKIPVAYRGNLLVLGLIDTVNQLKAAPPEVLEALRSRDRSDAGWMGRMKSFFKR